MEHDFTPWELDFFRKLKAYCDQFTPRVKAAEYLDISEGTLNSYLYKYRRPKYRTVEKIMRAMNETPLPYTERPPIIRRMDPNAYAEIVQGNDLPTIPVHNIAGAGNERDFWTSEPQRQIPVLPQYYHQNLAAVIIDGNSMEPTIKDGAIVGVIPVTELAEGKIYLVRRPPFGLLVKRVRMNEKGEIILCSDNPNYPPIVVPFEGYEDIIIGRVVWCWQDL
jgi:phage repressor protein C with HTH and peptisase S24 domain